MLFQQGKTVLRQASTLLGEFPKGGGTISRHVIVLDQQFASPRLATGAGEHGKNQHFGK